MKRIYEIGSYGVIETQEAPRSFKYFVVDAAGERQTAGYSNHTSCILKAQQLHKQAVGYQSCIEPTNVSFF